jgi:hypothetical protein
MKAGRAGGWVANGQMAKLPKGQMEAGRLGGRVVFVCFDHLTISAFL